MSKDKIQLLSPLFLKYQADYEKNPRSRVFAPLAETYRKLGMTEKAMEILAQGIRYNPDYAMGYLGLAFCYADLKQYTLAYNTLRPIVDTSRDNIRLQKLFADICLNLGYKEEALDAYKYLLFINPRDKEVALQVSALESVIDNQYKPVHQPIFIPESEFHNEPKSDIARLFDIDKLETKPNASKVDFDNWKTLDLSTESATPTAEDSYDSWNLTKGSPIIPASKAVVEEPKEVLEEEITYTIPEVEEKKYHDEEIHLDFDDSDDEEDFDLDESVSSDSQHVPLVTHTLVDLYCGQGHIEKALEVLEKILILNPRDQKTIDKISEIRALIEPITSQSAAVEEVKKETPKKEFTIPNLSIQQNVADDDASEEEGRKNLMDILDQQLGNVDLSALTSTLKRVEEPKKPKEKEKEIKKASAISNLDTTQKKNRQLEDKLNLFLKKIQKRALDYQSRV